MSAAGERVVASVLVVFAMEAEAAPFISRLNLVKDEPSRIHGPAPCITYSGQLGSLNVHLVWNGRDLVHGVDAVGTVPAALAAYLAIQAFQPDLVISAGTAGGFKSQKAAIGDIFLSTASLNHDRRIALPAFDKYGLGSADSIPTPKLQAALELKAGVVSSGNSLDYTDRCLTIMADHGVAVKEMEAAAIAWVCALYGTPFFSVKSITDIVDGDRPAAEQFMENLGLAVSALQSTLPKVLEFVAGKRIVDL